MRKICVFVAFIVMAVSATAASHDFQTGKLVNITSDERLIEGTTYRYAVFVVKSAISSIRRGEGGSDDIPAIPAMASSSAMPLRLLSKRAI